jgi:hypothetical protein
MAHYRIGDNLYDVDPTTWSNVEVSAVQRALGCSLQVFMERLGEMDVDAIQALIWTLRKRTEPSARIDSVTFTIREYMDSIEMSDQDVRDAWPTIPAESRDGFLSALDVDQVSRMFDLDRNLLPEASADPLESSPATET